jgi:tRNA pseudouridine38-40 synthase
VRIALGLEYDGTDWNGWQTQPNGKTVQDRLESAIHEFTGSHHATICAGRTDAGVHAKSQVVHFDTAIDRSDWSWIRGLNTLLPDSISVRWATVVSDAFHARYSALWRQYKYRVLHSPTRSPLHHRQTTWFYRPLDLAVMQKTATLFVGEHDFSAFRSSECQANSSIRHLMRFDIARDDDQLVFTLRGNAFLHHMVRNLVGTLIEVGRGAKTTDWAKEVRESRNRMLAGPTFPAEGLCFDHVEYDSNLLCVPESKFVD